MKRYGTVLYRHNGDLVHALNVSLGQVRTQTNTGTDCKSDTEDNFDSNLTQTCLTLNAKCHAYIRTLLREDAHSPHNIEDVDIESTISQLDPDLWKALCLLTQPFSPNAVKKANTSSTRTVRRFACLCMMLFTINSQCSFPLHTLITDAIETCGGSSRLIKLLNHLGFCASTDTHSRYVQYRTEKIMKDGLLKGYPDNAFTIASADNLDFIHSYARIYCGNQNSSWHGTTVQLVQPQPSTLVDTHAPNERQHLNIQSTCTCTTHGEATSDTSKRYASVTRHPQSPASATVEFRLHAHLSKRTYSMKSPVCSPGKHSPLPKRQRRMRTGTEGQLSDNSTPDLTPSRTLATPHTETSVVAPTMSINDFRTNDRETKSLEELEEMCNAYMVQKGGGQN